MKAEEWEKRLVPIEQRPEWARELLLDLLFVEQERDDLIADLAESEREAGILRDALAESERLRVEAEAKVAAWTKCVAQSSTQYREMVRVIDDARGMAHRHYTEDDCQECGVLRESIDAVLNERSTP